MPWRSKDGSQIRLGVIDSFDSGRGLGTVTEVGQDSKAAMAAAGTAALTGSAAERALEPRLESSVSYRFHSTAIADGSRTIEPGTEVAFVVAPAHGGGFEAREVMQLGGGDPPSP